MMTSSYVLVAVPSPALDALQKLPITPLSSGANSPESSKPSSRKGSFAQQRSSFSGGSSANSGSLQALTSIKNLNKASGQRATEGNGEIEEATEEEEVAMGEGGFLRMGNYTRLRRGSSKLRKMTNANNDHNVGGTEAEPASSSSSATLSAQPEQPSSPSSSLPLAPLPTPLSPAQKASLQLAKETKSSTQHADKEPLSPIEHAKKLAAYRAVDAHIKPHHKVIGIGSGSTVPYVVDRILAQGHEANKKRWVSLHMLKTYKCYCIADSPLRQFIPTGFQSKELIVSASLNLGDVGM